MPLRFLLLFLLPLAVQAAPGRLLADYTHTAWGRLQGAPADVVKFAQTADGWLWIASPGGLHRFDGARFERVEALQGQRLQSASTMGLLATRDGGLWIGHRFGGVTALRGGAVREFGEQDGLPPLAVFSLTEGPQGDVWAATGGGLAVLAPGAARFAVLGPAHGLPAGQARQVLFARSGRVWVSVRGGIFWRDPGQQQFQRAWPHLDLMAMAEGPDGAIWATDGATRGYRVHAAAPPGNRAPRPAFEANGIFFDRQGTAWLLQAGALERQQAPGVSGGAAQRLAPESGISGPLPQTWFEDREGNIWIGTSAGMDRLRRNRLQVLATDAPLDHPAMVADSEGRVVIGDQGATGVYSYDSAGRRLRREAGSISAGYRAADGALWFGNDQERWRRAPSGLLTRHPHPPAHAGSDVQAMTVDGAGRMWLSIAHTGLYRADGRHWVKDGGVAGLPGGQAPALASDQRGRVWVGYLRNRLAVIEQDRARVYGADDGLQLGNVLALHADGPRLWAGGEFGLAWFDGQRFRMVDGGEGGLRGISGIVRTAQGALWLHGSDGITHIAAPEVERLLAGLEQRPAWERFDARDGLPGSAEQYRPLPSLVAGSDGRLWFATASHVASLDPARIPRNGLAPPVQIRALRSGGKSYAPQEALRLPEGSDELEIDFTALSLAMPERVRFRYRLDGVDHGWQEAGTRREAFYTNLRPGSYRFHVMAANEDGVWNEAGAALELAIAPRFTQTRWFDALLLLAAALLLGGLYLLRVRQITARLHDLQQERLAERARIARGLHDTLLQSVQGLIMFFDRQAARLAPQSEERAKIEQTLALADQLMGESRDYIMDLRGGAATQDLAQTLRQYGAVLLHERFHFSLDGAARALAPAVREDLLSIGREALFNAARHSHASRIALRLDFGEGTFLLEVRDNGCGLGQAAAPAAAQGHFGLLGMQERAAAIGAACTLLAAPGGGTIVRLQLAAALAYRERRARGWRGRLHRLLQGGAAGLPQKR